MKSRRLSRRTQRMGAAAVEYVLVMAIVVCGVAAIFAPKPDSAFYDALRSAYRRAVVYVSVPLL